MEHIDRSKPSTRSPRRGRPTLARSAWTGALCLAFSILPAQTSAQPVAWMLPRTIEANQTTVVELNQIVWVETNIGDFAVRLREDVAPGTVENFLTYVAAGAYNNSVVHRSVPGFVVQTGMARITDTFQPHDPQKPGWTQFNLQPIQTRPAIRNEYRLSNLRGTLAMAKVGGNPHSATSQWFVNVEDNSANLDEQNGGFTVFGHVLGEGMTTVHGINTLPRINFGGPYNELPMQPFPGWNPAPQTAPAPGEPPPPPPAFQNFVRIESITPLTGVELISQTNSAAVLADQFTGTPRSISLTAGASGFSDVTVRYTGDGKTFEETVRVTAAPFDFLGLPPNTRPDHEFWLGRFDDTHFSRTANRGWLNHREHGWLLVDGKNHRDGIWMWDHIQQDWLWTNRATYPFVYSHTHETWLYYWRGGTPAERWFYDYRQVNGNAAGWVRVPAAQ